MVPQGGNPEDPPALLGIFVGELNGVEDNLFETA